jgi:hypothetical protein
MLDPRYVYAIRHKKSGLYYSFDRSNTTDLSKFPVVYRVRQDASFIAREHKSIEGELAIEYEIPTQIDGHKRLTKEIMGGDEDFEVVKFELVEVVEVVDNEEVM